ncbi:MAG: DNA gyrase inhibitor YacG [Luteitalea sp.]|nr:DNA gyrase inhibitor YacG [Luteitalea sp.]
MPVCVYCRRQPVSERWRPFCSERCKRLDLSRWLDGSYRIPDPEPPDSAEDPEAALIPDEDETGEASD